VVQTRQYRPVDFEVSGARGTGEASCAALTPQTGNKQTEPTMQQRKHSTPQQRNCLYDQTSVSAGFLALKSCLTPIIVSSNKFDLI